MNRPRNFLLSVWLLLLSCAPPGLADESGEIENLRRRLEKLESKETETEGFIVTEGNKKLNIWGAIEAEAGYTDGKDRAAASDINIATALLGLDVEIISRVEGRIALLHEDDEEPEVALDEAHLAVSWPEMMAGALTVTAGRNYLPFGNFASSMVSDPLTLELGETSKTALLTAWANDQISIQAAVYNGDYDTSGHDVIDNGLLALSFSPNDKIGFGLSYLYDLAETNAGLPGEATTSSEESVQAASAYLSLDFSPLTLNLEYLGALEEFSEAMLSDPDRSPELTGRKPRAWFAELGFSPNDDWSFCARYEKGGDYQDDVARYGATVSCGLYEQTVFSLEYLYSEYDRVAEASSSQATAQLALEF